MRRILSALGSALALTSATASAADTIEPGLYEVTTTTDAGSPTIAKQCLNAADIARGFQTADLGRDCKTIRSVVAGGKLDFAQSCPDMTMTATGTYTSTSYVINGKIQIKTDGETMTMASRGSGRKIGAACKP